MTEVSDVPAHPPGALHERAHAKLNLRLRILAREASGFHQLETLFCRLALHDDVWVAPAAGRAAGASSPSGGRSPPGVTLGV
ncbi:MAG: hypothetical protein WEB88_15360, partial [Gemmatimonadota bacterium]